MNPQSFAQFTGRIAGEVIVPASQAYGHVRTLFNQEGGQPPLYAARAMRIP